MLWSSDIQNKDACMKHELLCNDIFTRRRCFAGLIGVLSVDTNPCFPYPEKSGIAMCVGCGSQIHDQYILRVSPDLEWHAACLKCAECSQYLDETCTCFVRDGKTYCKRDYVRYEPRFICDFTALGFRRGPFHGFLTQTDMGKLRFYHQLKNKKRCCEGKSITIIANY